MAEPAKSDFGNSLNLVDIKDIRDNTVISKDGSMKQIVMVGGVNFALKSDLEQNIITQGYQNFLNSIDFPLQIVIHSRKVNIEKYVEQLSKRKELEESPILRSQIDEYAEFIRGFIEKNAIMEKMFLVVVPFYPGGLGDNKSMSGIFSLFGKKKAASKVDPKQKQAPNPDEEAAFRQSFLQLSERSSQVMAGLTQIGLDATILTNDELVELFFNFYNPQAVERTNVMAPQESS